MSSQFDLFVSPSVPGFSYAPDVLGEPEEADLIARIDAAPLTPFRYQQWTGKRLTASYGWSYDFATGTFAPTEPLPDWLLPIRDRAAAVAGLVADDLV